MVFIGRMQPPHRAHIEIILDALNIAKYVIIAIGSANQPRTFKNPWIWREREEMIRACFPVDAQERLLFLGVSDAASNQEWARSVQDIVSSVTPSGNSTDYNIGMIGHKKDDTSFYLDMFPQWPLTEIDIIDDIHSTDIRTQMFEDGSVNDDTIPIGIFNYLNAFMNSEEFACVKEEYEFIQQYKESWSSAPYPPIFVTVDAVVVQSGHVLLVKRRASPGRGTWAMVGGFINQNEYIEDAMIRELREETKIKVPEPVLKGNISVREVIDTPNRSLRGRTITHVFGIELPPGKLPRVKGSDDAEKAKWIPLDVFEKMQRQMFEDHWIVIKEIIGKM